MEMSLCNSFRSLAVLLLLLPLAQPFTLGRALTTDDDQDNASTHHEPKNELIRQNEIKFVNAKDETHQLKIPMTTINKDETVTPLSKRKDQEEKVVSNATLSEMEKSHSTSQINTTNLTTKSTETTTIDSFLENKADSSSNHSYSSSVVQHSNDSIDNTEPSKNDVHSGETLDETANVSQSRPVYSVAVPPPKVNNWKKYTNIDRTKNTVDDDGSNNELTASLPRRDGENGELTRIKLTDFTEKDEVTTISLSSILTEVPTITSEAEETTTDIFTEIEAEILSSKRGGYLNLSKTADTSVITKIAKKNQGKKKTTPIVITSTTVTPATSTTTTTTTTTTTSTTTTAAPAPAATELPAKSTTMRVAGDERVGQLTDDAIRDELLMEQILSDQAEIELVNKHRGDRNTKTTSEAPFKPETSTSGEGSVEDLSVKPISKSSLYTVGPNYKKMKKLDVTPARPLLRHPDDNSWRNESLSSLGIVFNAKNTSKTFTQVIKNKTESVIGSFEVNSSPTSSEAPELRQRLEKLAEERKRKKPNKSGELGEGEYDDYEPFYRHNGGYRSTIAPRARMPATARSVGTTEGRKPNVITTEKPRKVLSILEYFDTGDEEGFDYVTAPQIDLKKTSASRGTPPPTTAAEHIHDAVRQFPDRKPTLQYFPPRPYSKKPEPIDDEYDNEFKNKINQYTTKKSEEYETKVTTESYRVDYTTPTYKKQPERNFFYTKYGQGTPQSHAYHDNGYSKASYIIRHQGDAVTAAPAQSPPPRFTALPPPTTLADYLLGLKTTAEDEYVLFKKQMIEGQFDADKGPAYPVVYNNSVVHEQFGGGRVLSSSFLRLQAAGRAAADEPALAYDLHYYAPEQEERQEVDLKVLAPGVLE